MYCILPESEYNARITQSLNRLRHTAQTFASAFRRRLQNVIETPQSAMNNYSTTISGTSTNSLIPHEDFTIHAGVPGYCRRRYAQIRANSSQLSHQNRVCSLIPQQARGRIPAESLYLNTYSYLCARRTRRSFIGSSKAAAEIWKQCLHPHWRKRCFRESETAAMCAYCRAPRIILRQGATRGVLPLAVVSVLHCSGQPPAVPPPSQPLQENSASSPPSVSCAA